MKQKLDKRFRINMGLKESVQWDILDKTYAKNLYYRKAIGKSIALITFNRLRNMIDLLCNTYQDWWGFRFYVCLKLFLVMGVYWSLELIYTLGDCNHDSWISFILVFMNCIQGIFVFLIFVCKRRVIRLLHQKYCIQLYFKFFPTSFESEKTEEHEMKLKSGSAENYNESE